tara:strand:+ start:853 stop:1434 length:582 start_codon:yes stop_codon:yes gene_type:complete
MRDQSQYTPQNLDDSKLNDSDRDNSHQIYRYKFQSNIIDLLTKFSKTHQYDPKKIYKEAWDMFVDENSEELGREVIRLNDLGYDGDCFDKMYKSARYYFRKKTLSKIEPKKRRKYIACDRDVLDAMDDHINKNIKSEDYKPSDGYDNFIKSNQSLILSEINRMIDNGLNDNNAIVKKIKKTYKNRYFQIMRST